MAINILAVMLVVIAAPAALAVEHTVGDSSGWTQGVDYSTWASGKTFAVGDTLLFQYTNSHSVDQVSQSNYNNCNSGSPIKSHSGGRTTINLDTSGSMYFICPTAGHCEGGMKLAINVTAASTSPSPSGSPSPPGTPASPPPPPPPSGAAGNFGNRNYLGIVVSLLVAAFVAFMG